MRNPMFEDALGVKLTSVMRVFSNKIFSVDFNNELIVDWSKWSQIVFEHVGSHLQESRFGLITIT